jgi:hypothetical protein
MQLEPLNRPLGFSNYPCPVLKTKINFSGHVSERMTDSSFIISEILRKRKIESEYSENVSKRPKLNIKELFHSEINPTIQNLSSNHLIFPLS